MLLSRSHFDCDRVTRSLAHIDISVCMGGFYIYIACAKGMHSLRMPVALQSIIRHRAPTQTEQLYRLMVLFSFLICCFYFLFSRVNALYQLLSAEAKPVIINDDEKNGKISLH